MCSINGLFVMSEEDILKTSDFKVEKTDDKKETEKIRVSKKLYYS